MGQVIRDSVDRPMLKVDHHWSIQYDEISGQDTIRKRRGKLTVGLGNNELMTVYTLSIEHVYFNPRNIIEQFGG